MITSQRCWTDFFRPCGTLNLLAGDLPSHKWLGYFHDGGLKADDVRALNHVREREGADIALFISLDDCTKGMIKDAASAGFYESPNQKKYPRVQLLTIEGLLSKKQRAEHPDYEPDLNFKKAKTEANAAQKELI